jgi:predicted ribonuclease toxin of YeeF-YezG toxin-antitoxin module
MPAPLVVIVGGIVARQAIKQGEKAMARRAARKKAAEEARKKAARDAARKKKREETCPKCDSTYKRPSGYRKGVRDKVWDDAKGPDGKVRDPLTGKEMKKNEPWDMGHKPGHEFRKHQQDAANRGIDRKQFLDEHNNPRSYRPELPSSNRSHMGEAADDIFLGM